MANDYQARRAAKRKKGKDAQGNFHTIGILKRGLQGKKPRKCRGMCYKGTVPTLQQIRDDDANGKTRGNGGQRRRNDAKQEQKTAKKAQNAGKAVEHRANIEPRLRASSSRCALSADVLAPVKFAGRARALLAKAAAAAEADGEGSFAVLLVGSAEACMDVGESLRNDLESTHVQILMTEAEARRFVRAHGGRPPRRSSGTNDDEEDEDDDGDVFEEQLVVVAENAMSVAAVRSICSLAACRVGVVYGVRRFLGSTDAPEAELAARRVAECMLLVTGDGGRARAPPQCVVLMTRDDVDLSREILVMIKKVGGVAGSALLKLAEAAEKIEQYKANQAKTNGTALSSLPQENGDEERRQRARSERVTLTRRFCHPLLIASSSLLGPSGKVLSSIMTTKKRLSFQQSMLAAVKRSRQHADSRRCKQF